MSPKLTVKVYEDEFRYLDKDGDPYTGELIFSLHVLNRMSEEPEGSPLYEKHYNVVEGRFEGEATFRGKDGNIERKINFKKGNKHGPETVYLKMFGSEYHVVSYKDDLMHGDAKGFNNDGKLVWLMAFKNGVPASFSHKGEIYIGRVGYSVPGKKDLHSGPDKGKVYKGNSDVPFTGVAASFYANGGIKTFSEFENGKRNGMYESKRPDGRVELFGQYNDGKKHGVQLHAYGLVSFMFYLEDRIQLGFSSLYSVKAEGWRDDSSLSFWMSDEVYHLIENSKEHIINKTSEFNERRTSE